MAMPKRRLLEDQQGREDRQGERREQALKRAVVAAEAQVTGQRHAEGDLHQLGRLQVQRAQVDPGPGALDDGDAAEAVVGHAGGDGVDQQQQADAVEGPGVAADLHVVHDLEQAHADQADAEEDELLDRRSARASAQMLTTPSDASTATATSTGQLVAIASCCQIRFMGCREDATDGAKDDG